MRNILFEANPIDTSTGLPVTIRMSAMWADATGVDVNSQVWLPCITAGPQRSIALFQDGEIAPIQIDHGSISFTISATEFNNLSWATLNWSGTTAKVWVGAMGATFANYTQIFQGRVGPLERDGLTASVVLTGSEADLDYDLLTASYGGTGGTEGPAELKGTRKPWCSGAVSNVEPVLVDSVNWVYQLHGYGAIGGISAVYENALTLNASQGDYATYTALVGASLAEGQWATCLAAGLFRLGAEPSGKITADATGAKDGATAPTSISGIATHLIKWAGVSAANIDATTFGTFTQGWCFYAKEQISVGDVVRAAFQQAGGYVFATSTAVWKAGSLFTTKTPTNLQTGTVRGNPQVLSVKMPGASDPAYRVKIGAQHCWSTHTDGEIAQILLNAAQDAIVGYLTNESQMIATASDGSGGNYSPATGTFKLFEGLNDMTTSGQVSYALGTGTNVTGATIDTGGVYSISGLTADQGTQIFTATYKGVSIAKTFSITKSKAGSNGTAASTIYIVSDRQTISYDYTGVLNPGLQPTTFTAVKSNTTGTVNWSVATLENPSVPLTPVTTYLSAATGDTVTMTSAQFSSGATGLGLIVTGTISGVGSDKISVVKVQQGPQGLAGANGTAATVAILTNEAATVAADSSGNVSSFSTAGGQMRVFNGLTEVTGSCTFTVVSNTGVNVSFPGTDGSYTVASMSADNGIATLRATYNGNSYDKIYTISKSRAGTAGTGAKMMYLTSTHQTFQYPPGATVPTTQTTTLVANRQNTAVTTTWKLMKMDGTNVTPITSYITATGDQATITQTQFDNFCDTFSQSGLIVRAEFTDSGTTYFDQISIVKVSDGLNGTNGYDAVTGFLTNEAVVLGADSAGTVGSFAAATGTFKVFYGSTDVTSSCSFSLVTSSGCTTSAPSASGVYSVTAMSADTATATYQAIYNPGNGAVSIQKIFSLSKSKTGTTGSPGANAKTLYVSSDRQTIFYDTNGTASPTTQTTTLTVNRQNTTNTVTWSITDANGVARTPVSTYLTVAGDTLSATMTEAQFASARNGTSGVIVTTTISADGISDKISIVRVQDGAVGGTGATGSPGSNGMNVAVAYLYQRATSTPAKPSVNVTYTFGAASPISGQNNGWLTSIPSGSSPLYVITAVASNSSSSDLIAPTDWSTPTIMAQDGATGPTGASGRNAIVYNQDANPTGQITGDTWYKPTAKEWYQWNGSAWVRLLGNLASFDSVGASQIAVNSLSAISATIGTLQTAGSGARMVIQDNLLTVYDAANVLRVRLGIF